MKITIAICTWNRAPSLRTTLESIAIALPPQESTFEIVVINNNCTDVTDQIPEEFAARLPILLHHEKRAGLSHARNKAIDVASGEYIIWIDDDVTVRADWLIAYEQAFIRWPEVSLFGGAIIPRFEGKPPTWLRWMLPWVSTAFSTRNFAEGPIDPGGALPFGANFAVRTREQRRFGYDTRLGRRPGNALIGGEEADVILAILEAGGTGRWVRAAVDHWIPRSRRNFSYLLAFYWSQYWYVPELRKRWPNLNRRGI
jgi:glycosyltransferase involved in cell wall biosynthesis